MKWILRTLAVLFALAIAVSSYAYMLNQASIEQCLARGGEPTQFHDGTRACSP